jgi:hypothetical protein
MCVGVNMQKYILNAIELLTFINCIYNVDIRKTVAKMVVVVCYVVLIF